MTTRRRPIRYLRLILIATGVGLGLLLRAVLGPYDPDAGNRHFKAPASPKKLTGTVSCCSSQWGEGIG